MSKQGFTPPNIESSAIHAHLTMLQDIIRRMANNSSSCKTWCVTIVAAVLVMVADKGKPEYAWLALLPVFPFFALDAYYLGFEKGFRTSYESFVEKLHEGGLSEKEVFVLDPSGNIWMHRLTAVLSFSTWGFYVPFMLLVVVAKFLVFESS